MDAELTPQDFIVPTLGPATFPSPLGLSTVHGDGLGDFVPRWSRGSATTLKANRASLLTPT